MWWWWFAKEVVRMEGKGGGGRKEKTAIPLHPAVEPRPEPEATNDSLILLYYFPLFFFIFFRNPEVLSEQGRAK